MATTWCPIVNSNAYTAVGQAHDKFMNLSTQSYNLVIGSLDAMGNIPLEPYEFNISFQFDGALTPFQRPAKPVLDFSDFVINTPASVGPVPTYVPTPLAFDAPPELTTAPPSLTFGPRPTSPNIALPNEPENPRALVLPTAPGYVLPEVPTFEQLQLPARPDVNIPTFDSVLPTLVEPPFDDNWTFTPTAYESVLLDRLVATIDPMLQSKPALPAAIEAAIFQKGANRIEVETQRERNANWDDWGSRGFDAPPGMLAARDMQIRQAGQDRIAEFSREAVIKQFEETLANLRFAVVQGAAIEGVYIQLHTEELRYALEASRFGRESTIAILNYRLSVFQARMQGIEVEARVFESEIRAELAKIEIFRAEIEGEKALGEINDQKVRLYVGQISAINAMAEFYRTQMDGVRAEADVQRLQFERYREQVNAYDSRWKAYVAEWQGFSAGVEGEGKRADLYKTLVEAYGKRVDSWDTQQKFKLSAEELRISQHGQQLSTFNARLADRSNFLETERARLLAATSRVGAQAQMYDADAKVEQYASAASDRSYELLMKKAELTMESQLKTADMLINQAKNLTDQMIAIADAKMRTGTQLTASSMSAVGYSASISGSTANNSGCNTNFTFNGEVGDA